MSNKNKKTATNVLYIAIGMFALAYASVPLYETFCRLTGFAGYTKTAVKAPDIILDQEIKVNFNANISKDLSWKFKPVQNSITLKIGEEGLAFYTAKNTSKKPITGTATYNVTPLTASKYFSKIECFCFTEQTLAPGEEVTMPVSFYINPEITKTKNLKDLKELTLSYSFFKVR